MQAVKLGSICDISRVQSFHASLLDDLDSQGPVRILGSRVQRVDTAFLQTLVALVRELRSLEREVVWEAPSRALLEAARVLGLSKTLGLREDS
jgi:anti-anti-sigma regulatory factor